APRCLPSLARAGTAGAALSCRFWKTDPNTMADAIEILVPDIGDYDDVPVIEILVTAGERVAKDQGLVTLESDKATMEVPASVAGIVREIRVKVGDRVGQGRVVALVEAEGAAASPARAAAASPAAAKVEAPASATA